jgi:hypothetical protein
MAVSHGRDADPKFAPPTRCTRPVRFFRIQQSFKRLFATCDAHGVRSQCAGSAVLPAVSAGDGTTNYESHGPRFQANKLDVVAHCKYDVRVRHRCR